MGATKEWQQEHSHGVLLVYIYIGALRFATPNLDFGAAVVGSQLSAPLYIENTSDVELRWRVDGVVQVERSGLDWDPAPELSAPNALDDVGLAAARVAADNKGSEVGAAWEGGAGGGGAAYSRGGRFLGGGPSLNNLQLPTPGGAYASSSSSSSTSTMAHLQALPMDILKEWQQARAVAELAAEQSYSADFGGSSGGGAALAPAAVGAEEGQQQQPQQLLVGVQSRPPRPPFGTFTRTLSLRTMDAGVLYPVAAASPLEAAELGKLGAAAAAAAAAAGDDILGAMSSRLPSIIEEGEGGGEEGLFMGGSSRSLGMDGDAAAAAAASSSSHAGGGGGGGAQQYRSPLLTFDPPSATIPPHSKQRITLTFRPAFTALYRFRLYLELLTAHNNAAAPVGGAAVPRGSEYGDIDELPSGRAAKERAPLHYLPGSAVSRAAAFAAAAAASADFTDPASRDLENGGSSSSSKPLPSAPAAAANTSPLFADITARGALPYFCVEDARAFASRESYLATFPAHWRGAAQTHCAAFAGEGGGGGTTQRPLPAWCSMRPRGHWLGGAVPPGGGWGHPTLPGWGGTPRVHPSPLGV